MLLYIHLVSIAENELKSVSYFNHIFDEKLEKFLRDYCPIYEYDIEGLIENEIKTFEIKYNKTMKIPKFTMQLYSFIYDCLMDFPTTKFDQIKTVTTRGFLGKIYKILNAKVHLHHPHVSGEIHGYSHDYCNWKSRENKQYVPLIGHNFLGFDIFYMVKGYRSVCWGTKDFNMGGTNLTNVNFANIGSQVKIIDTLKYYQTTLTNITSTTDEIEKSQIKKTVQNFLLKHTYFSKHWPDINETDNDKILDIISEDKGALPYEKIIDINSLQISPENAFFDHTEFFSNLNQANVPCKIYDNMKYLYTTLKMRILGDMNDLYDTQDVILLCEIIENRF